MTEHRWSGWPGAWCLDCGCEDPRERALADGDWDEDDENGMPVLKVSEAEMTCPEPGSNRFNPYTKKDEPS